jgi:hypothetical protein
MSSRTPHRNRRRDHRSPSDRVPPAAKSRTPVLDQLTADDRAIFRDQTDAYEHELELRARADDLVLELVHTLDMIVWVGDRRRALESDGASVIAERPGGEPTADEAGLVPLDLHVFECAPRNVLRALNDAMQAAGETLSAPMPPKNFITVMLHNAGYANSEIQELLGLASVGAAKVKKSTAWSQIDELVTDGRAAWLGDPDDR